MNPIFDVEGRPAARSQVAGSSLKLASLIIVDGIHNLAHPVVRYSSGFAQQSVSIASHFPLDIWTRSEKATDEMNCIEH